MLDFRRREFITLIGCGAAAWPLTVSAQQPGMPVIGYLGSGPAELYAEFLRAFRRGLKEIGYIEGQNLAIEYRWAEQNDRLPVLATDLVGRKLAVIVADSTPSVQALHAATSTIPIIFFTAGDPVALGLVASLNRPGGNLTGTTAILLARRDVTNTFRGEIRPRMRLRAGWYAVSRGRQCDDMVEFLEVLDEQISRRTGLSHS
jgi:ABC-type uncharacterized transport system substrate-binding protein